MNFKMIMTLISLGSLPLMAQKQYQLQSPDTKMQVVVTVGDDLTFSLTHDGTPVLNASLVSMTLQSGEVLGVSPKITKVLKATSDKKMPSPFYKKKEVQDIYNEMTLHFKGNYGLVFRLYDEGLAYRFLTNKKDSIIITDEQAVYNLPGNYQAFVPYVKPRQTDPFFSSFENTYVNQPVMQLDDQQLMFLPMVVSLTDGKKLCITEADLENYPGMYLQSSNQNPVLQSVHAPYPKVKQQGGHNNLQMIVTEREDYLAKTNGTRAFPWRVLIVSGNDAQLADCDMVYRLASPSRLKDISWIKPGKVAWDWWNDWNIYGVDFRSGINNDTYKYYIDFAANHGIEYVILDEGWSVNGAADLLQVIPEIDIPALVAYGKSKNVDIILWAGYHAFDRDMEQVVKHYADMGVKGFKVDFMDRDDQEMIDFLYRGAETCAKYNMLVDYHGICKPTGLQRTYPNVINYEGVHGLENMKWSPASVDQVTYDVTIPFIRMVAGPMDYTQGAMRNGARHNYAPINSEPMSQGTRCRQLATYVIFESPLNMLCDNPSNYMREAECTDFISAIPTVWDETVAIDGQVGEYIAMARRAGNDWYIGSMTDWTPRDMILDLSFLGDGNYEIEYFKDGINADRAGNDYKKEIVYVPADRKLSVSMAPGGGFAGKITRK